MATLTFLLKCSTFIEVLGTNKFFYEQLIYSFNNNYTTFLTSFDFFYLVFIKQEPKNTIHFTNQNLYLNNKSQIPPNPIDLT